MSKIWGFTLIELLVTIGILAVVAAGVIAVINPTEKIDQANDSKVINDIGQIVTALQSYYIDTGGFYPPNSGSLVPRELVVYPTAPNNYSAYTYTAAPGGCTTACTSVVVTGQLKSDKYTAFPTYRFDTSTFKPCAWNGTSCKP